MTGDTHLFLNRTAIVWRNFKPVLHLKDHEQAVWAVKCVGEDRFLTGMLLSLASLELEYSSKPLTASADKLIRLFNMQGKVVQTFRGHTDCVRALSLTTDGRGFFSAANDGYAQCLL